MVTAVNPILPGFYPDPSICRVGKDYYIVNSSFAYFPGVPVFHSRDLAHWEQIGNVLMTEEQLPLYGSEISRGIFAPTLRYNDGTFYLITTNVSFGGNFIVTAQNPAGPWSKPYYLGEKAKGIDPSLFFDEDGKCYYVGTRPNPSGVRHNGDWEIWVQELDLNAMKLVGESMAIWKGALKDCIWPEGPHLYKKEGYYYLVIAEGGTGPEHSISVARSRKLMTWFEGCPRNPVFSHRNLGADYPVIYAGHGDFVCDENGNWYVVMLASRPCEECCSMGRETFLASVTWENDWPLINAGVGHLTEQVKLPYEAYHFPQEIGHMDILHFYGEKLDERLVSLQQRKSESYTLKEREGFLRLYLKKASLEEPYDATYFGLRQKDYRFKASAGIDFLPQKEGESAGLALFQNHKNHLCLDIRTEENTRKAVLTAWVDGADTRLAECTLLETGLVELFLHASEQKADFYVKEEKREKTLLAANVDLLFYTTEAAGGFVGCTIGIYATANGQESHNYADAAWLCYEGFANVSQ